MLPQKLFQVLFGPLWWCVLRQAQEILAEINEIEPRTNLDFFNSYLHFDLDDIFLKSYTTEDALDILWNDYKESDIYKYQLQTLQALVPSLTNEIFKNGCKRLYCLNSNELNENGVFMEYGNNTIYNFQIQLLPPYNFYLDFLKMPIEEEARNRVKKEIYADYERHLKQIKYSELLVKYRPDAVMRLISKSHIPKKAIKKFHTELNRMLTSAGMFWVEQERAEIGLEEGLADDTNLSENQSRQLHTGVEIGTPMGFFGKLASGGGGWIGLLFLLMLLVEMLRQYFKNPSNMDGLEIDTGAKQALVLKPLEK